MYWKPSILETQYIGNPIHQCILGFQYTLVLSQGSCPVRVLSGPVPGPGPDPGPDRGQHSIYWKPCILETQYIGNPEYRNPNILETENIGNPVYWKPRISETQYIGNPIYYWKPCKLETQYIGNPVYCSRVRSGPGSGPGPGTGPGAADCD